MKTITHKPCGGKVAEENAAKQWRCLGCGARWSFDQIDGMPYQRREAAFSMHWSRESDTPTKGSGFKLVEVEEGRRRFTRLVPK